MKNKWRVFSFILIGLLAAFVGLVTITGYQCCHSPADGASAALADQRPSGNEAAVAAPGEQISVYSVPLRCPLVTGLGCGSESKPIMTKLDSQSAVAGSWLNHAGTTLAVLWNEDTDVLKRADAITTAFQDYPTPTELTGEGRDISLKSFLSAVAWYRATALDDLSRQEADIVARRWVDKITSIVPLPKSMRESLHCTLSDRMHRRFVKNSN